MSNWTFFVTITDPKGTSIDVRNNARYYVSTKVMNMKKITTQLASLISLFMLVFSVSVFAQAPIQDVDDSSDDLSALESAEDESEQESATTAKSPDTGIAPENRLLASTMVFAGGAALGGLLGFSYIQLKKRNQI